MSRHSVAGGGQKAVSSKEERVLEKVVPERDFAISGGFTIVDGPVLENSLTVTDFGGLDIGIHQAMRRSIGFATNSRDNDAG